MHAGQETSNTVETSGSDLPLLRTPLPGPRSQAWLEVQRRVAAPMGQPPEKDALEPAPTLILAQGRGANVLDADGNRYVDLAAGFGALLLGHGHPEILGALESQSVRLLQALGDVYASEPKILLLERLTRLYPGAARAIIGQSGSDAVTAALKTAVLFSGRAGVLAFKGAYHGLGYGPLAACGLRESYRLPFDSQLNPHLEFLDYPSSETELARTLESARKALLSGNFGAVLVEPILGRGGVVTPPLRFLPELSSLARECSALLIADEVWTGLGRSGRMVHALPQVTPDLICLGKGLGGGVPISAVVGRAEVMTSWQRPAEVVHTSTFAGAPLAAAAALVTLDVLEREQLPERSATVGADFRRTLEEGLKDRAPAARVRGAGLMVGIDLGARAGLGSLLQQELLKRGYITSTGGGEREVLVLTPPLIIDPRLLNAFSDEVADVLGWIERKRA